MAPKRKSEQATEELTARDRKKIKMAAARLIETQTAVAGPFNVSSLQGLPSAINVEKFAEARAFEINAMQKAMKAASEASTHRVWQTLPRHLRRRAASHDVRRVPLRLRDKARMEMDPVRKKALGRSMPKRGKINKTTRTESFLRRQRDKTWLETHLWHAKRMKMENMWGFRLAVHPTEKAYRPSHRASMHGSILHDASYFPIFELVGPEKALIATLELLCDPQGLGPGSKRCLGGSRTLETHMYQPGSYPYDLIGPASIIWKPLGQPLESNKASTSLAVGHNSSGQAKGQGKMDTDLPAAQVDQTQSRILWLRFHPVISDAIKIALENAVSEVSGKLTSSNPSNVPTIVISDLSRQVNVFEIMGPRASQVIKGALSPVSQDKRDEFQKFWSSMATLQTASQVPRGMIIGLKVTDPRLKFPPKVANVKTMSSNSNPVVTFPSTSLATSDIWDKTQRATLAKPRFRKKDLDERRSKNAIPGTLLNALRQDDRIPLLLIQRSVETNSIHAQSQAIHGWTLIIPAGWSMAFLNSLIFSNTRVGGQRERQTQAYEAGTAYFPRDYPGTEAYENYAKEQQKIGRDKWNKKPPAKRVNHSISGVDSPWKSDWRIVLKLPLLPHSGEVATDEADFVPTQREPLNASHDGFDGIRPWLLRGQDLDGIFSRMTTMFNRSAGLLSEINNLRHKRGLGSKIPGSKAPGLLQGALVSVKVAMCKRGTPQDLAVIYLMEDSEVIVCEKELRSGSMENMDEDSESKLETTTPKKEAIIGYVTTGHFSLARGEGFAIGAIPVLEMLNLHSQASRLFPNKIKNGKSINPYVKVRNVDEQHCRVATVQIFSS